MESAGGIWTIGDVAIRPRFSFSARRYEGKMGTIITGRAVIAVFRSIFQLPFDTECHDAA